MTLNYKFSVYDWIQCFLHHRALYEAGLDAYNKTNNNKNFRDAVKVNQIISFSLIKRYEETLESKIIHLNSPKYTRFLKYVCFKLFI